MNILAFLLSFFAGAISFLHGGYVVLLGFLAGDFGKTVGDGEITDVALTAGAAGALIVLASFTGLIGGVLAAFKRKAGLILLAISAIIAALSIGYGFKDGYIYGILYGLAAIFSYASISKKTSPTRR